MILFKRYYINSLLVYRYSKFIEYRFQSYYYSSTSSTTCNDIDINRNTTTNTNITTNNIYRIAIIGSGPSAFYTCKFLLSKNPHIYIDMFEKLALPFGLVRYGVAPDHQDVKTVTKTFEEIAINNRFRYFGNITIGDFYQNKVSSNCIHVKQLKKVYSAIVFAYGASSDIQMNIAGSNLKNIVSAREFVNWMNGHSDYSHIGNQIVFDKITDVVIIGNGNVAIDCARILSKAKNELLYTDIVSSALEKISTSNINSITLLGRRGPVQASFTIKELRDLTKLRDVSVHIDPLDIQEGMTNASLIELENNRPKSRILDLMKSIQSEDKGKKDLNHKKICLKFLSTPIAFISDSHDVNSVTRVIIERNKLIGDSFKQKAKGLNKYFSLPCQLVITSIGFKSLPIDSTIPFDYINNIIPNNNGRVTVANDVFCHQFFVTGWLKRGPNGIIASNIPDARETAECILEDIENGDIDDRVEDPLIELHKWIDFTSVVSWDDCKYIHELEVSLGKESIPNKVRQKFTNTNEILAICHQRKMK